jgi:hypothetical protein
MIFWLYIVGTVLAVSWIHLQGNLRKIEANWSAYRCNPAYMPFAGIVDPETGIAGNFQHCMNMMGKPIIGSMVDALGSQFSLIAGMLDDIANPIAIFRRMITGMRNVIGSFASSTLSKASGPVSIFVFYLAKIRDLMNRMASEGYLFAMFGATMISYIEGFVSLLIGIIKTFVIAMLIIAFVLALFNPVMFAFVLAVAASLTAAGA